MQGAGGADKVADLFAEVGRRLVDRPLVSLRCRGAD